MSASQCSLETKNETVETLSQLLNAVKHGEIFRYDKSQKYSETVTIRLTAYNRSYNYLLTFLVFHGYSLTKERMENFSFLHRKLIKEREKKNFFF